MRAVPFAGVALIAAACARGPAPAALPASAVDPLDGLAVPDLPLWTNKYADDREAFGTFFAISRLMDRYGLSRLDAVEVQNRFRDLRRDAPSGDPSAQLGAAVDTVRAGRRESGLDPAVLDAARFVVVFDLDETLYDQYYPADLAEGCHSFRAEGRPVQLAPGWDRAFAAVRALGGAVVLFSANVDAPTLANTEAWTWEGRPVRGHPDIAGVLTNSYLTLQEKSEGTRPDPVSEPSKDLRQLDPTLDRVVIVDDNPTRLFQFANARVTRKFHADAWCRDDVDPALRAALGGELDAVVAELHDAVAWWDAHPDATFQRAFLPYTVLGRLAVDALVAANGWGRDVAIAYVRTHDDAADGRF